MKKIIIVIIVLAIAVGYFVTKPKNQKSESESKGASSQETLSQLPQGWKQIDSTKVSLKLEKTVEKGTKPQIVFKEVQSDEASSPAKYTNTIIAGAKSAIPSFKITDDKRDSQEKYYSATLAGTYLNRGEKLNLLQRVYIKDKTVDVITATFAGDISVEVNQIIDDIVKQKITL